VVLAAQLSDWDEVAAVDLRTVHGECVDFGAVVLAPPETFTGTPSAVEATDDDISTARGPLALHAKKLIARVEDKVVAGVGEWLQHDNAEFDCGVGDGGLRDYALLVRCQHGKQTTVVLGRN